MKKFICALLLIISMGSMYYFSSQDGKTSSIQSGEVTEVADNIFQKLRQEITLTDDRLINIKDKILNYCNFILLFFLIHLYLNLIILLMLFFFVPHHIYFLLCTL